MKATLVPQMPLQYSSMDTPHFITADTSLTTSVVDEVIRPLDTNPNQTAGLDFTSVLGMLGSAYSKKLCTLHRAEEETLAKFNEVYQDYMNFKCGDQIIPQSTTETQINEVKYENGFCIIDQDPSRELRELDYVLNLRNATVEKSILSSTPYKELSKTFPDVFEISDSRELWQKKITVPEPFNMTIREEERNSQKRRSSLANSDSTPKCFHSNPIPAHVHLPMYQLMTEQSEKIRQERIDTRKQKLLAQVKPFHLSFSKKSDSNRLVRSQSLTNLNTQSSQFTASPFPRHLFHKSTRNEQLIMEDIRKLRIKTRAEEMMKQSALPFTGKRTLQRWNSSGCLNSSQAVQKLTQTPKPNKSVTVQSPTHRTENITRNKRHVNCIPVHHTQPMIRKPVYAQPTLDNSVSYKVTKTVVLRNEKRLIDEELLKRQAELEEAERYIKKSKQMRLQREVALKIKMHNPIPFSPDEIREKLLSHKRSQQNRSKEYTQDMQDMRERLKKRPLLIEQQVQQACRDAAVRRIQSGRAGFTLQDKSPSRQDENAEDSPTHSRGSDFGSDDSGSSAEKEDDHDEQASEVSSPHNSYQHSLSYADDE